MCKLAKEAKKRFQPGASAPCAFGSRAARVKMPIGTPPEAYCWGAMVTIIQPKKDKNGTLCYLVEDSERKMVGIAVINTHDDSRSLLVGHGEWLPYTNDENKHLVLTELRGRLS